MTLNLDSAIKSHCGYSVSYIDSIIVAGDKKRNYGDIVIIPLYLFVLKLSDGSETEEVHCADVGCAGDLEDDEGEETHEEHVEVGEVNEGVMMFARQCAHLIPDVDVNKETEYGGDYVETLQ